MAEEIQVTVDDKQEEVSLFISDGEDGVTKPELDALNVAFTDEENTFTEDQSISTFRKLKFLGSNHLIEFVNISDKLILSIINNTSSLTVNTYEFLIGSFKSTGTDLGTSAGKWKELFLSSYANVLGVKSVENDPTKVFATDGTRVNVRQNDRLNAVGNINSSTLALDFDSYEGWDAVLTEALTLSITNPKFKVVTVDLDGNFPTSYPAEWTIIGDGADSTVRRTLTIHYTDASNILVIVTNWV